MLTKTQQVQSDHIIHVDRTIMSSMADPPDIWKRVHRLSERILGANLATEALEAWCRENAIGDGRVIALRAPDPAPETMDEESLEALYPYSPDKSARFRCVRLATAGTVIVNALNWYFPENLSRDICTKLDTTDIPFGRAVNPSNLTTQKKSRRHLRHSSIELSCMEAMGLRSPSCMSGSLRRLSCRRRHDTFIMLA